MTYYEHHKFFVLLLLTVAAQAEDASAIADQAAAGTRKPTLEAAPAPEKDWGPTKPTTVREALRGEA